MLRGHVFQEQVFGNQIFALFINTFLDGHDGIINNYKNSLQLSYSGSDVTVDSGAICIQGRFLEEDSSTTINAGSNTLFCKLVLEINLDKQNTESEFNQGAYKIITGELDYPTLTQEEVIKNNAGVYQYELARFKTGVSGISDFADKRTFLDFESIYTELEKQSTLATKEELESKLSKTGGVLTGQLTGRTIVPSANSLYDLGNPSAFWRALYITDIVSHNYRLYNSSSQAILGVDTGFTVRSKSDINTFMPISASAFNVNSSKRYKENVSEMSVEEANKLDDINIVKFDYKVKDNGVNQTGVIAEDVYEVLPNVVTMTEIDGEKVPDSVDYSKFVPYLIKKIQLQEMRLKELENKQE